MGARDKGSARRELIAIQKRLYRVLREEIEASLEGAGADVKIYLEEYERDLRGYEAIATRKELVDAVVSSDLVYVGDYHTLPHSQRTLTKLLLAASRARRPIVVALELVHATHQAHLDAYMHGQISEEEFKKAIRYEETWGFEWRNYRDIFEVARKRKLRVVGINSDPRGHDRDRLLERDFRTAEIIVRETVADPSALVIVFDGDLHVARDHLPLIVDTLLQRAGTKRRHTIVHQNSEAIYWRLANDGREQEVDVVRLADDAFCVLNATPIEKLQSYLNWESERDEMTPVVSWDDWESERDGDEEEDDDDEGNPDNDGPDYSEQVLGFVQTIARFLEIERDDLDDFELFTVRDLDWLDAVEDRFTPAEVEDLKRQVESGNSCFIPRGNIIYLANASVSGAAEEATHFLHAKCAGITDTAREPFTAFYQHCVTEALGFFGSKLIDHKRECWTEVDCQLFVDRHAKDHRRLDPAGQIRFVLAGLVLQHKRNERQWLATSEWRRLERIYHQPTEIFYGVAHILGHALGDKLYEGLVAGRLEKRWIRDLFSHRFDDRTAAFFQYLALIKKTQGIDHAHASRGERL